MAGVEQAPQAVVVVQAAAGVMTEHLVQVEQELAVKVLEVELQRGLLAAVGGLVQ
jgi:hypothetical protein